ncbi:hypothetical protein OH76DRAFT_1489558 [Lentinus brumalis]|uniref:Uncharacterized protein n=1 Tax=Lentinus brumalis TaxID=2498619 RepID=A0A371CM37_9APHY|nr:hypothetical protein OH76DRAFT_1489558 [Polyporus brumalis]
MERQHGNASILPIPKSLHPSPFPTHPALAPSEHRGQSSTTVQSLRQHHSQLQVQDGQNTPATTDLNYSPPQTDVYARWSGFTKRPHTPEEFATAVHSYAVKRVPAIPLELGTSVRIMALSPTKYRSPKADEYEYDVYDPHVQGRISKVLGWRGELIALEVVNECIVNRAKLVRLEVPYIPGQTVARLDARLGKGPSIAEENNTFDPRLVIGRLPREARCAKSRCAPRADAFFGFGGADDPHESGAGTGGGRSSSAPRKKPGVLEAVGWSNRK